MITPIQDRLRTFATTLLERRSALLDWFPEAEEGLAVLPPQLAATLNWPEMARLRTDFADGAVSLDFSGDFLQRVESLIDAEPMEGRFQIPELYLKRSAMDDPVARVFQWHHVATRLLPAVPTKVEYHAWTFLARLDSEERWEQLVSVSINTVTGASVDRSPLLTLTDLQLAELNGDISPEAYRCASGHAMRLSGSASAAFLARLEGRLDRDRARLKSYYKALLNEDQLHRAVRTLEEIKARQQPVKLELRRKLLELEERFAIKARLTPVALVRLEMPALAIPIEIRKKQARTVHRLFWNPLTKAMEPLRCNQCGRDIFSIHFYSQSLAPACGGCLPH